MTIYSWLNHRLNPFKLKSSAAVLLRTQAALRNAAFSSCAHRICQQNVAKRMAVAKPSGIWRQLGNILQREKDFDLCRFCSATRQFHVVGKSVRFQEEKKPETLQDLVEATEKPETAVTVGQKGIATIETLPQSAFLIEMHLPCSYLVHLGEAFTP